MLTRINTIINDWVRIKNHCRTTVNKNFTENEPSEKFKLDLLISEHSPIRLLEIDWSWFEMPYWVSTEWSRHKFEKFISTQRKDRTGINRGKMPQETPVKYDGYANAQNLIDSERKRLCRMATIEARTYGEDLKVALHEDEPELSNVLVPNCVYRCSCPEFEPCGFFEAFIKQNPNVNMFDIRERYDAYEKMIMEKYNAKKED